MRKLYVRLAAERRKVADQCRVSLIRVALKPPRQPVQRRTRQHRHRSMQPFMRRDQERNLPDCYSWFSRISLPRAKTAGAHHADH